MAFNLPVVGSQPRFNPQPKGQSRLQAKVEKQIDERKEECRWQREIWTRDKGCCRWCARKVIKTLEHLPERGECHHLEPRENRVTRWHRRNGLLLCGSCHERVTGRVNERFVVVASKTYAIDGVEYPNGDQKVTFKRIA